MKTTDEFPAKLAAELERLRTERETIDERIAALELACEAFGGAPATPKKPRVRRDHKGLEKTLDLLTTRGKATTIATVARVLHCTEVAANTRLSSLVKAGKIHRVKRGIYSATVVS